MKRNLKGLIKFASLTKKADPLHRGLNDDNPVKRSIYKKYGYIPQSEDSYFASIDNDSVKHEDKDFHPSYSDALSSLAKMYSPTNHTWQAYAYDYAKAAGLIQNSGYAKRPNTIMLGSYPYDGYNTWRHEKGHSIDPELKTADLGFASPDEQIPYEINANRLGGFEPGNEEREAWLDTYRAGSDNNITNMTPAGLAIYNSTKEPWLQRALLQRRAAELSANNYTPIRYSLHEVRQLPTYTIYDLQTAIDAINRSSEQDGIWRSFPVSSILFDVYRRALHDKEKDEQ